MARSRRRPRQEGKKPLIAVGVDPCSVSRAAMRWATALAGWLDARVIVVHALGPARTIGRGVVPAHSIGPQVSSTLDRDWCTPLRRAGIPYRLLVRSGAPVDVLHDIVETQGPDVLVVGRHDAALGWTRSSTSLGLLAQPQIPTLVVPETSPDPSAPATAGAPHPVPRTLVGVDGSAPSRRALDLATDLAEIVGGEVVAVAAVEDVPVFPLGPSTAVSSEGETEAPARAAAMLTAACGPARDHGVRVRTVCQRGAPAAVLLRLAEDLDAELTVVGTRGVGSPDRPMLGSVSRRLVCDSPRPVWVVPATPGARALG